MKSTAIKSLDHIVRAKAPVAAAPAAGHATVTNIRIPAMKPVTVDRSKVHHHAPGVSRGKVVMMAMKINRKFHPDMFKPDGNPRVDVGRFGSL